MKKGMKILLLTVTLLLCILLFAQRLTGDVLHAILGMVLTVLLLIHTGRHIMKLRHRSMAIRIADVALFLSLLLLLLPGIVIHPMEGVMILKILHKLSGVVFVLCLVIHAVQHRGNRHVS